MKFNQILTAIFAFCCILPTTVNSAVLFQENFDNQADWQPRPATGNVYPSGATASCHSGDCTGKVPPGWSYFRSTGWWWGSQYEDTIRITNEQHRGPSGKAYIQWNESNKGASGDGWGADGILAKYFETGYQELFVEFYLKLNPNWQWSAKDNGLIKIFRASSWDPSTSGAFQFFSGGGHGPIYVFDLMKSVNYGWRHSHAMRCAPQTNYYYCPDNEVPSNYRFDANFSDTGQFGDGEWHKMTFHLKLNTKIGSTWQSNGVIEFWYDDELKHAESDKMWIYEGDDNRKWNLIGIGGNAFNTFASPSTQTEQWYTIDDITISTTPISGSTETNAPTITRMLQAK